MKGLLTWSLPLCRVAGIPVLVHWSWFVVAYFQIARPFHDYRYGWTGWYVLEYLALFGLVLLHEFGHAFACRSVGGTVERIVLWPLGGLALVNPPPRPGPTLWSVAAGPLVNLVLAPVFFGLLYLTARAGGRQANPDLVQFTLHVLAIDVALLVFNLVPVYPLDGGQILRALLWFVLGQGRSLSVVSFIGIMAGVALCVYGQWLIGIFIGLGAAAGLLRADRLSRPGGTALFDSITLLQHGKYAEVRDNCTLAIGQIENDPAALAIAHAHRGIAVLALGELDQALADQAEAVQLVPDAISYLMRGITHLARSESESANDDLAEVLRLKPASAAAHRFRAIIRQQNGEHDQAIADCSEAIRYDPRDLLAYLTRSISLAQAGQIDRASADFEAAQRLDAERAHQHTADGRMILSLSDCVRALTAEGDSLFVQLTIAAARNRREDPAHQKQVNEAIESTVEGGVLKVINLLLWLRPRSAFLLVERAVCLNRMKAYRQAASDYEEALRIDPQRMLACNNFAWLLATCPDPAWRDGTRALELATRACELSKWENPSMIGTLAAAHAAAGNFAEAFRYQEQAHEFTAYRLEHEATSRQRLKLFAEGKPYMTE